LTPLRQVARLAGPAIAQQLLHTMVFLVDRAGGVRALVLVRGQGWLAHRV